MTYQIGCPTCKAIAGEFCVSRGKRTLSEEDTVSQAEDEFALHCSIYKLTPEREYRFDEKRRWRLDFAWPEKFIAVEIEGGVFSGGRHVRGKGFTEDCKKYNRLAMLGWRLFRFTPEMVHSGEAIDTVVEALKI